MKYCIASLLTFQSHNGKATVYYQGGVAGKCGHVHADSDKVVSVGQHWYNKYGKGICGHRVKIQNTGATTDNSVGGKGRVVYANVADLCTGCSEAHLNLSLGAWNALTNNHGPSVVGIHW